MNQDEQDLELGRSVRKLLKPADIDWVERRAECTLSKTWNQLRERLKSDVQAWNQRTSEKGAASTEDAPRGGLVIFGGTGTREQAEVIRMPNQLVVLMQGEGERPLTLVPKLNAQGECVLLHDNQEFTIGQASRLILEPLLFRE